MNKTTLGLAGLGFAGLLLTGCAPAGTTGGPHPAGRMTPGMIMPDGSTMGAVVAGDPATTASSKQPTEPSAATKMICTGDTRDNLAKVLAVPSVPAGSATWTGGTYTCRYRLPVGALVLSVHESTDGAAADAFADGVRADLGRTHDLDGLTAHAFATTDGVVVLVKDNDTLRVDARALPPTFGSQHERRDDFAYEVASDILGCWTGGS